MGEQDRVFAKCAWRLVPFMMLLYLVNFIDRVNVGFAALTMNKDLGFSASVFGFGAGIFFLGYVLFQVPANIVIERLGARRWIFCILAVWGLLSASTAFVQGPLSFYGLRFLLGLGESGFFPGMIFYLTLWFPKEYRARQMANFALAVPLSGIIGGPLSGSILRLDGIGGLHGWQWLFLLEGLPAFLLAFVALVWMPDRPAAAPWLSAAEKRHIADALKREAAAEEGNVRQALSDWRFWAMGLAGFFVAPANYGIALWLPQIVQAMGFSEFATGFVVALPSLASVAAMIVVARSSDRNKERIWHFALPVLVAAAGFAIASVAENYVLQIGALTLAMAAFLAGVYGPFYSLLSSLSTGKTAAAGIALANAIVIVGGFIGPTVIGALKDQTGGYGAGMVFLAVALVFAAVIFVGIGRALMPRATMATAATAT